MIIEILLSLYTFACVVHSENDIHVVFISDDDTAIVTADVANILQSKGWFGNVKDFTAASFTANQPTLSTYGVQAIDSEYALNGDDVTTDSVQTAHPHYTALKPVAGDAYYFYLIADPIYITNDLSEAMNPDWHRVQQRKQSMQLALSQHYADATFSVQILGAVPNPQIEALPSPNEKPAFYAAMLLRIEQLLNKYATQQQQQQQEQQSPSESSEHEWVLQKADDWFANEWYQRQNEHNVHVMQLRQRFTDLMFRLSADDECIFAADACKQGCVCGMDAFEDEDDAAAASMRYVCVDDESDDGPLECPETEQSNVWQQYEKYDDVLTGKIAERGYDHVYQSDDPDIFVEDDALSMTPYDNAVMIVCYALVVIAGCLAMGCVGGALCGLICGCMSKCKKQQIQDRNANGSGNDEGYAQHTNTFERQTFDAVVTNA